MANPTIVDLSSLTPNRDPSPSMRLHHPIAPRDVGIPYDEAVETINSIGYGATITPLQHQLTIKHKEVDLVLETSSGEQSSILSRLSSSQQLRFKQIIGQLSNGAENYELDLGNLIASADTEFKGLKSDMALVKELRGLAQNALGVKCKAWDAYLSGYPSAKYGPRLFVQKGMRLQNMQFKEEHLHEALKNQSKEIQQQILKGHSSAPHVRSILEETLKTHRDRVKADKNITNENERASRLQKLEAAIQKLELRSGGGGDQYFDETALLFEATHPLPDDAKKEDFKKKHDASKAFIESQEEPYSDRASWNPWNKASRPTNQQAQDEWKRDAARVAFDRENWHLAQLSIQGSKHKGNGIELYPMYLSRQMVKGSTDQELESAVRAPLSTLLFGDLHHKDLGDCQHEAISNLKLLNQAVAATPPPPLSAGMTPEAMAKAYKADFNARYKKVKADAKQNSI
jgi:hypothetical protein